MTASTPRLFARPEPNFDGSVGGCAAGSYVGIDRIDTRYRPERCQAGLWSAVQILQIGEERAVFGSTAIESDGTHRDLL